MKVKGILKWLTGVHSSNLTCNSLNGLPILYILPKNIEVVVFIHAASAVDKDKSSQIGMLVMVRHELKRTFNVINFVSSKSKRVCKSVLVAELFALVDGLIVVIRPRMRSLN